MTNEQLNARINELWTATKRGELPRQARFAAIERLTDEYIEATGRRPDPAMLDRLATLCLYEEVTDDRAWKMKQDEYPVMSDDQYDRRKYGTRRTTKDGKSYEVKLKAALTYGTDGVDHSKGKRRQLSINEMIAMDKAKIRNTERRKKYREFIKPSKVVITRLGESELIRK